MLKNPFFISPMFCAACLRPTYSKEGEECCGYLCWDCSIEVENSKITRPISLQVSPSALHPFQRSVSVNAVFHYSNTVRQIILNAKIRKNNWAIIYLKKIFCASFKNWLGQKKVDYVLPFPSSVPGRFLGELDLAWTMAYTLHKQFDMPVRHFSWRHYWRFKKEAKRQKHSRDRLSPNLCLMEPVFSEAPPNPNTFDRRGVMIDDIITSGATLYRCLQYKNSDNMDSLMVLASALPLV